MANHIKTCGGRHCRQCRHWMHWMHNTSEGNAFARQATRRSRHAAKAAIKKGQHPDGIISIPSIRKV